MLNLAIGILIGLLIATAYHGVLRPFIRNLLSRRIMRQNYSQRKKLWEMIKDRRKRRLFFKISIRNLKTQTAKKTV